MTACAPHTEGNGPSWGLCLRGAARLRASSSGGRGFWARGPGRFDLAEGLQGKTRLRFRGGFLCRWLVGGGLCQGSRKI